VLQTLPTFRQNAALQTPSSTLGSPFTRPEEVTNDTWQTK